MALKLVQNKKFLKKIKIFCSLKDTTKKMKVHKLGNTFTKQTFERRIVSRIYQELLQCRNMITNQLNIGQVLFYPESDPVVGSA